MKKNLNELLYALKNSTKSSSLVVLATLLSTTSTHASSSIGFYDPGVSNYYLKNEFSPGAADFIVNFGSSTGQIGQLPQVPRTSGTLMPNCAVIPISGDWNGDGVVTIGFYNQSTGTFFFKNANAGGNADRTLRFGAAQCENLPIVGDWTGTGESRVGIYVPSTSTFFLKYDLNDGPADATFQFGPASTGYAMGAIPIAGDWDGNGKESIGLYMPTQNSGESPTYYLKDENTAGGADYTVTFGTVEYRETKGSNQRDLLTWPIAGRFTDGLKSGIGFLNRKTMTYFIKDLPGSGSADHTITFGSPLSSDSVPSANLYTRFPLVGSWNEFWSPEENFSASLPYDLATNRRGALFSVSFEPGKYIVKRRIADSKTGIFGEWRDQQEITYPSLRGNIQPSAKLVVSHGGQGALVWLQVPNCTYDNSGQHCDYTFNASYFNGESWSSPVVIASGSNVYNLRLNAAALDSKGRLITAWSQGNTGSSPGGSLKIHRFDFNSGQGSFQTIPEIGDQANLYISYKFVGLEVDKNSNVFLAVLKDYTLRYSVFIDENNEWTQGQVSSVNGANTNEVALKVDDAGNAWLVQLVFNGYPSSNKVYARKFSAENSTWGALESIDDPVNGLVNKLNLDVSLEGHVLVNWTQEKRINPLYEYSLTTKIFNPGENGGWTDSLVVDTATSGGSPLTFHNNLGVTMSSDGHALMTYNRVAFMATSCGPSGCGGYSKQEFQSKTYNPVFNWYQPHRISNRENAFVEAFIPNGPGAKILVVQDSVVDESGKEVGRTKPVLFTVYPKVDTTQSNNTPGLFSKFLYK